MKRIVLAIFLSGCFWGQSPAAERVWYLNTFGVAKHYAISRYNDRGEAVPPTPVIEPSGSIKGLAWPSAIKVGRQTFLYASEQSDGAWRTIGLWQSNDGIRFTKTSDVLQSTSAEPFGIGPAYFFRVSERAGFGAYYLIRGKLGPGASVGYATSRDGIHWMRQKPAFEIGKSLGLIGLSVSYACRAPNGYWLLGLAGYETFDTQSSFLVRARNPDGPFSGLQEIMKPDGVQTMVLSGFQHQDRLIVSDGHDLVVGQIYFVAGKTPDVSEPIVVRKILGDNVFLERPLLMSHLHQPLYSMARSKVEISYIRASRSGWSGIATFYGPSPGIHAEYTASVKAAAIGGPWKQSGRGLRFSPWLKDQRYSAENPTPVTDGPNCN